MSHERLVVLSMKRMQVANVVTAAVAAVLLWRSSRRPAGRPSQIHSQESIKGRAGPSMVAGKRPLVGLRGGPWPIQETES